MTRPFIIFGLPRSRTFWLSRFLSYGEWHCGHDEIRHARSMDDVDAWFRQPCVGTAETAGAPWWRLVQKYEPRVVVVRRPVAEVVASLMRCHEFDAAALERQLRYLDAKLDQIEARVPGVLSVRYQDLTDEMACAEVFEHCLPYRHDPKWWAAADGMNLQVSVPALMRYMEANRPALEKMQKTAKHLAIAGMSGEASADIDGVTIQEETYEAAFPDAQDLFAEHSLSIGEAPDSYLNKNQDLIKSLCKMGAAQILTARCNGRVFGYLMTIISPSLESPNIRSATNTLFYASKEFPGLGMKLQRAAVVALREKGVDELFLRAGVRGAAEKISVLYRRLGAADDGRWFKLNLKDN